MKTIAVTNRKGGVGKSTMSVHIAAGLAIRGYRVGIIDTDSQGHAGLLLDMPEENGLFNALVGNQPVEQVVREVPTHHYASVDLPLSGALYLLPSADLTYKIPYELPASEVFAVLELIEVIGETYTLDVILIDTNPTMSLFDSHIYMASDGFIYVTECERLSFDGIEKATAQVMNLAKSRRRYLGRDSEIVGIIPNKLRANTVLHRHNISQLAQVYGEDIIWSPVILRTAWAEAASLGETIYKYAALAGDAKDAQGARLAANNAWALIDDMEGVLKAWQVTKTE